MHLATKASLVTALILVVTMGPTSTLLGQNPFRLPGVETPVAAQTAAAKADPVLPAPTPIEKPASSQPSPTRPKPSPGCYFLAARSFSIPFSVDAGGSKPTEVQLFAARGPNARWQRIDAKPANSSVKAFQFAGHEDGEMWFATRTIDSVGRQHPAGPIQAQLKVYVDTTKPQANLAADADASGLVQLELAVSDDTDCKVQVRYITDVVKTWQTIDATLLTQSGELGFKPEQEWEQLSMQVIVSDAANNRTVISRLLKRPRIAEQPNSRFAAAGSTSGNVSAKSVQFRSGAVQKPAYDASGSTSGGIEMPNRLRGGGLPSTPVSNPFFQPPPSIQSVRTPAAPASNPVVQSEQPSLAIGPQQVVAAEAQANPLAVDNPLSANELPAPKQFGGDDRDQPTGDLDLAAPKSPPSVTGTLPYPRNWSPATLPPPADDANDESRPRPRTAAEAMRPITPGPQPESDSQLDSGNPQPDSENPQPGSMSGTQPNTQNIPAPQGQAEENRFRSERPANLMPTADRTPVRFSDSVRFSLDYELEAVGNIGVESVELYGSTDSGQTWKFWGADPDLQSPFDIETKSDGLFGFRIVVVSRNGLASPRPLPGEAPDLMVRVDQVAPTVRISAAKYGEGDRVGSLVIRYECQDDNLMDRPIALSFSESIDGPWTTIAAGLRNDGSYVWPADPGLPRQMHLRIDATDKSGNVGTYVLDQPIDVQGLAPRARIRGFQPLSEAASESAGEQTAERPRGLFK